MKYWLLTTEFPPFYGGGISTYCGQTCAMLCQAGQEVTVFLPVYEDHQTGITLENTVRVIRFNPSGAPTSRFLGHEANLSFIFAEEVIRLIQKEGKPEIIESQEYLGIAYYLLQKKHLDYKELQGIQFVLTLHAPSFLYLEFNQVSVYKHPNFWVSEMEKFCIRAADTCIAPSAYLVQTLKSRMNLDDKPISILPNPYRVSDVPETLPAYTPDEFIFYGKLIPQKGCIELLAYFKELWEEGQSLTLRLIGGGNHFFHPVNMDLGVYLKRKYKKYVDSGLLILEGAISPAEITQRLSKAHAILIPSIVDNLPYTVLEAMSSGKVVLVSKQGGQAEVIDPGKDGFVFDHQVQGDFRKALETIRSLPADQIHAIGRNAIQKIRLAYAPEVIGPRKLDLLNQFVPGQDKTVFPLIRPEDSLPGIPFNAVNQLLSVVVPYYNMGAFLPETMASIKASGYSELEIIIVNDGSTEPESLAVLEQYQTDPQLKIIHQPNQGLALARNTGAREAKGDFLAFLDPDDTVEPDYYLRAVALLKAKQNISFTGCWAQYFGESSDTWPTFNPEPPYVLLHNCLNTSALVYKRVHFLEAGLNDARMIYGMEDYDSLLGMIEKGYRGAAFPETWWNYRIRKNSMAQAFTQNSKLYLYKLLSEKHHALYCKYGKELFMLLNTNGPSIDIDNPTLVRGNYSKFTGSILGQRLIRLLKNNKYMRPIALSIYKRFFN
ncbi:MAG TPA: glycosyltransferase [Bacteroidia bacterium]|jgi:glycosyltransferase involved in cell wall biosynthesis|nr:glycosyltransferase [Bacteroidia bacterium]